MNTYYSSIDTQTVFGLENPGQLLRNFVLYSVGVGLLAVGALGLADAIELSVMISVIAFTIGIGAVLVVHEYLGGPI
ncbi:hypothetical protein HUB97_01720 [Halorubraceae archaeon YAN]|nr:hypothetical protein [Halorubraceae archaeon YAN]